jgi:5'-3' exonuclease
MVEGELQRFCQQCNKFHPVSMFDGSKRGCRDKLEKHNKR